MRAHQKTRDDVEGAQMRHFYKTKYKTRYMAHGGHAAYRNPRHDDDEDSEDEFPVRLTSNPNLNANLNSLRDRKASYAPQFPGNHAASTQSYRAFGSTAPDPTPVRRGVPVNEVGRPGDPNPDLNLKPDLNPDLNSGVSYYPGPPGSPGSPGSPMATWSSREARDIRGTFTFTSTLALIPTRTLFSEATSKI